MAEDRLNIESARSNPGTFTFTTFTQKCINFESDSLHIIIAHILRRLGTIRDHVAHVISRLALRFPHRVHSVSARRGPHLMGLPLRSLP